MSTPPGPWLTYSTAGYIRQFTVVVRSIVGSTVVADDEDERRGDTDAREARGSANWGMRAPDSGDVTHLCQPRDITWSPPPANSSTADCLKIRVRPDNGAQNTSSVVIPNFIYFIYIRFFKFGTNICTIICKFLNKYVGKNNPIIINFQLRRGGEERCPSKLWFRALRSTFGQKHPLQYDNMVQNVLKKMLSPLVIF